MQRQHWQLAAVAARCAFLAHKKTQARESQVRSVCAKFTHMQHIQMSEIYTYVIYIYTYILVYLSWVWTYFTNCTVVHYDLITALPQYHITISAHCVIIFSYSFLIITFVIVIQIIYKCANYTNTRNANMREMYKYVVCMYALTTAKLYICQLRNCTRAN